MKIVGVRAVVVNAEMRNWVFVKVETDSPGLYGWGEASLEWKTRAVQGAVADLEPLILGDDPLRIEHIYQKLYRHSYFRMGVIGMSAISAIDQALWDIAGKYHGVPVFMLLGGMVREKVRMYTHLGGGRFQDVYNTQQLQDYSDRMAELATDVVDQGYTALKVLATPSTESLARFGEIRLAETALRAIRDVVGDQVDLMVDCHGRHFYGSSATLIQAMEPFHPYFVEEPIPPENPAMLAKLTKASRVPIATGERLVTRFQFRELLERGAAHVIQPDLCHCGGLSEGKRIAAMAETYFVGVAPHNPLGPVANAVALHFALSTPNFLIQEDMLADVPWRWDVVDAAPPREAGYWLPPDKPGLGIEVNEDEAAKHPFVQEHLTPLEALAHDGAILDW